MVARVRISPAGARVSMPGFNVDTAGDAQCLLAVGKYPIQIMQAGQITIPPGGSQAVNFGYDLGYVPAALYQSADGSSVISPSRATEGWTTTSAQRQPVRRSRETWRTVFTCYDSVNRIVQYIIFRRPG